MTIQELVNMIVQNGMSVIIIAYFLYKDYKFNEQIIDTLTAIDKVLGKLETWHASEEKGV